MYIAYSQQPQVYTMYIAYSQQPQVYTMYMNERAEQLDSQQQLVLFKREKKQVVRIQIYNHLPQLLW